MWVKPAKNKLSIGSKTEILLSLLNSPEGDLEIPAGFSAPQMRELRDFLEEQIVYLSGLSGDHPFTPAEIKDRLEPIPNYYYKQDCREPLEACYNETCFASYPSCFKKKMDTQLKVILEIIKEYL